MTHIERTPDEIRAILKKLVDLQEVDKEIRDVRKRMTLLPAKHKALDARLAQEHAEVERLASHKTDSGKDRHKLEKEVRELDTEIKTHDDKRMKCKTNIEIKAVDLEIAVIRRKIDALETRILEIIEQEESHDRKVAEAKKKLELLEKELGEERDRIGEQLRSKEEKITRLTKESERMRAGIPADVLALYDRLSTRVENVVCPAVGNHCGGCHITLVNQIMVEIRQMKTFVRCEGCLRIFTGEEEG